MGSAVAARYMSVGIKPSYLIPFFQASIMIREKKKEGGDLLKTSNPSVVEKNKSLSVEKDGKEKGVDDSPGNGVQYVVTYVGTAQQVESSSQTRSGLI